MEVLHVPPAKVLVTELARGRMGHTAGSNTTHSTSQTVSQNNFIVPEIEVVRKAGTWKGRGVQEGKQKEGCKGRKGGTREVVCVKWGDWKRASLKDSAIVGTNRVSSFQ